MAYRDWKAIYIDKTKTFEAWRSETDSLTVSAAHDKVVVKKSVAEKNIDMMSTSDVPKWAPRDKSKIISKEEYAKLRELAELNGIALSGVKKFDGSAEVVREIIETLATLQEKFPGVRDDRHKFTLSIDRTMGTKDFAVTRGKIISLNEDAYRDIDVLAAEYQEMVKSGWFVEGTTWRAIVHHEFGHIVANVYKIDSLKIACEVAGLKPKEILPYVKEILSEYASGFADGSEIISEVFADISTGEPCEFSRKFYEKILALAGGEQ